MTVISAIYQGGPLYVRVTIKLQMPTMCHLELPDIRAIIIPKLYEGGHLMPWSPKRPQYATLPRMDTICNVEPTYIKVF